jgi:hypothetical protein
MTTPFLTHDLYEINDSLEIAKDKVGDHEYIYIDNFYKNGEQIYKMLKETWVPNWKLHKDTKNFKKYYDCRLKIPLTNYGVDKEHKTINTLKHMLNLHDHYCDSIRFNIFQWIDVPSSNIQFRPHIDDSFNILIYLDKKCSGGTAIYEDMPQDLIEEEIDIRCDISNNKFDIIPAKFNRCVIFNGKLPHGGYIEDHKKYCSDTWRYNAVYFLESKK